MIIRYLFPAPVTRLEESAPSSFPSVPSNNATVRITMPKYLKDIVETSQEYSNCLDPSGPTDVLKHFSNIALNAFRTFTSCSRCFVARIERDFRGLSRTQQRKSVARGEGSSRVSLFATASCTRKDTRSGVGQGIDEGRTSRVNACTGRLEKISRLLNT